MSLLPESATYLEQVTAYFLAFRGDGVVLSPLDAKLLGSWHDREVPYSVVCRGIRKAAESRLYDARPGRARLRTLRSCRTAVEREFKRFSGLSAGRTAAGSAKPPEHFALQRLKKARTALRKALGSAPSGAHSKGLAVALSLLDVECDQPGAVAALIARADDALTLAYLRALPFADRSRLVREARVAAGPRPAGASARARKDALRAHLVARGRAHGALVALA
jgi:hypothetical protein